MSKLSKLRRIAHSMSDALGREPTDEELSDELGLEAVTVTNLKNVAARPASMDSLLSGEVGATLGSLLVDEQAEDPLEALSGKDLRDKSRGIAHRAEKQGAGGGRPPFRFGRTPTHDPRADRRGTRLHPGKGEANSAGRPQADAAHFFQTPVAAVPASGGGQPSPVTRRSHHLASSRPLCGLGVPR